MPTKKKKPGTFFLEGEAAGIYCAAQDGKLPETEEEADKLLVCMIHIMMQGQKLDGAVAVFKQTRALGSLSYARALVEDVIGRKAIEES